MFTAELELFWQKWNDLCVCVGGGLSRGHFCIKQEIVQDHLKSSSNYKFLICSAAKGRGAELSGLSLASLSYWFFLPLCPGPGASWRRRVSVRSLQVVAGMFEATPFSNAGWGE